MDGMLLPAESESGKTCFVLKNCLTRLIKERKIQKFRRSSEWLDVDADQRRKDPGGYNGPKRRLSSIVDCTLFPLSIEEQLRRGYSLEAILGYGERAREIALKLKNVA